MKKPLPVSNVKKKNHRGEKRKIKNSPLKKFSVSEKNNDQLKQMIHLLKEELFEKVDQKFNTLNHRFDRMEDGIEEILDELRTTEALLESESEPYEGQA